MENSFVISYLPGQHLIQKLNGTTKLLLLVSSLSLIMISFDIRILIPTFALNIIFLISVKPKWQQIREITYFIVFMNLFNILLMYLVSPTIGVSEIGHSDVWFSIIGRYVVTPETLFYLSVRLLKIFSMFIASLWFVLSITPSELGVGLYRLHVPYKICTVVSLGLRSIPDISRNYREIKNSLQMRGLELDKKRVSVFKRLKQSVTILIPLLLSTFERVDVIASAMDLRLYGIGKKRSYYSYKKPTRNDQFFRLIVIIQLIVFAVYLVVVVFLRPAGAGRVWYPW